MLHPHNQADALTVGMVQRLFCQDDKAGEVVAAVLDSGHQKLQSVHPGALDRTDGSQRRVLLLCDQLGGGCGVGVGVGSQLRVCL